MHRALSRSRGVDIAELPAYDRAVSVLHNGSMETIGATWQALHEHIEAQGARPSGPCREIYLETPLDDPEGCVTELQQPVASTA